MTLNTAALSTATSSTLTLNSATPAAVVPAIDNQLANRARAALVNNPHLPRRMVRLEANAGRVVLTGKVNTFFQKQMAQESLRRIEGIEQIENLLEVHWE